MAHDRGAPDTGRLALTDVTLCAATSVNLEATLRALEACLSGITFAACKLFTDQAVPPRHPEIEVVPIAPITSAADYSDFLLSGMAAHVESTHCLVVQWDGHVLDPGKWRAEFLDYDYVGARWPQFDDGHDVGNGGFSLRSRRLMTACGDPAFKRTDVEDVAIGRTNRRWLEGQGMRFAPAALADRFSAERAGDPAASFGYHGVWNMPRALGIASFWQIYERLDDRKTAMHDFGAIWRDVGGGQGGAGRQARMALDYLKFRLGLGQ